MGMENLVFCSSYHPSTLLRNLQRTAPNTLPSIMVYGQAFRRKGLTLSTTRDYVEQICGFGPCDPSPVTGGPIIPMPQILPYVASKSDHSL